MLLAAIVVKSLPLGAVRWLVITVVVYTATIVLVPLCWKPGRQEPQRSCARAVERQDGGR